MNREWKAPDNAQDKAADEATFSAMADETSPREGGDDALAQTDPADGRADELVIANRQMNDPAESGPASHAAHSDEGFSNDADTTGR